MLVYHRDRMLEAAQHFDFHAVASYLSDGAKLHQTLLDRVWEWIKNGGEDGPLKLRLLFDREGKLEVDIGPLPKVPLSTLYPESLDPPPSTPIRHPADTAPTPAVHPLTGGVLTLGLTDALPSSPTLAPEWKLKLDTSSTPSSPFTLLKTTYRSFYDQSRSRALPINPLHPMLSEVMLYNEVSEMTEGSMTSLYLFRGGRWVTPPVGVPAGEFSSETLKGSGPRSELEGGAKAEIGDREEESREEGDGRQDEGELRKPFLGRWGHSVRSAKVGAGGQRGTTRRWALGQGMCMEEPVSVDTVEVGEGVWVSNGVRGFGFGRVVA
jgi:4-amino-4-deoxychorismate lyase